VVAGYDGQLHGGGDGEVVGTQARTEGSGMVARVGTEAAHRARFALVGRDTVVGQAGCVCAPVKSIGQPDAVNPHVRLDEGAPVVEVTYGRALLDTHFVTFQ